MSTGLEQQIRSVADAAFEQTSPVRYVPPVAERHAARSVSTRWWLTIAAGVLVLALVGGIVLIGGSDDAPVAPVDSSPSTTSPATGTIEQTAPDFSRQFSARGVLTMVPLPGDEPVMGVRVGGADLAAIAALTGVEPTGGDDAPSRDWLDVLFRRDSVFLLDSMLLVEALQEPDGFEDEFGFSVLDVDRYVTATNYLGAAVDQLTFPFDAMVLGGDMAALTQRAGEDSIVDIGDAADGQADILDRSEFRPVGEPIRIGVDGSRSMVAVSKSTPFVTAWLDTDGPTMADVPDLAAAAAVLDRDDQLYTAQFDVFDRDVDLAPDLAGQQSAADFPIVEPFTAMALGSSGVDESHRTTIVYVFADERAASASAAPIARLYAPDTEITAIELDDIETVGDVFILDEVTVVGRSVAVAGGAGDGGPNDIRRALLATFGPFIGHR